MSLKDQLLKAGLVSKKQVRKVNQKERKQRKKHQSSREAKAIVQTREKTERKAKAAAEKAERIAVRRQLHRDREAVEAVRRVDQILGGNRVRYRGGQQPLWHLSPDRCFALRLDLPASVAFDIHCGKLAIGYRGAPDAFEPDIVVLPRDAAERVHRIDPSRILFMNDTRPEGADEALWSPAPTS
jgi:uncharacterized protein YaiL (DUF2058 family)